MKEKFPRLAPVFMSMLVARAFETGGHVEEGDMVLEASRKYRRSQDHISAFVSEKIVRTNDPKDKLKKTEVFAEFKKWYEESQGTRKTPRGDELYEFMNKRYGQCKATGWQGVKIIYPDEEEE
jgi:phage/plasmid-associated DNA primase